MGFTIVILRFGNLRLNNNRVESEDTIISYYENGNGAKSGHVLRLGGILVKCLLIKFFNGQWSLKKGVHQANL